jgi:hypothetical protein
MTFLDADHSLSRSKLLAASNTPGFPFSFQFLAASNIPGFSSFP